MPLRNKIEQILHRVLGMPGVDTQAQSAVEETPTSSTPTISPVSEKNTAPRTSDAAPELILYGRPSCPYCLRVDRVIRQMGIENKITRRLTGYGSEWRADLRNRTGSTQVPCLFIDGEPMFESLDIIDWLRKNLG